MKKMMIIAALIGGMLMRAQMMAKNNQNAKPRIEYKNSKKEKPGDKKFKKDKPGNNKYSNRPGNDRKYKPGKPGKPMPPVVAKRPKPRPRPIPRPAPKKVYVYQNNDAINAAAAVIGIAGLIALIAD